MLQSIPLCSRGQNKSNEVPPLELDKNNNDPTLVVNNQPVAVEGATTIPPPDATSTPRRRNPSQEVDDDAFDADDGLELSSGFENPHFGQSRDDLEEDDIGPVVDQVIGSSDEDDSGLALQEFRKKHNMDDLRRETMTPPPAPDALDDFDDQFGDDLLDDDDDDDETINVEDADSRDLSSSDDPVERPPEPRVPEEDPKRLSPSGGSSEDESSKPYFSKNDPTTAAISNMLSEIVGDKPHNDMSTAISR